MANLRSKRIAGLFRPHWKRLVLIGATVAGASAVTITNPFLLREILDTAIPGQRPGLISLLALGMIAVAVASALLAVVQATASAVVGQRLMHSLRVAVYANMQRLSLDFYTRTKAGEIQTRIAGDITGLQSVLTTTAGQLITAISSIVASLVAMVVLDWRLTLVSLVIVPVFVWIGRRVGRVRQNLAGVKQQRVSAMSSFVGESLSISGIILGKSFGRTQDMTKQFTELSDDLAQTEFKAALAGRWHSASFQMVTASLPILIYWSAIFTFTGDGVSVGTIVAFTALQTQLVWPANSLLRLILEARSSLALFDRVFDYLDLVPSVAEPRSPRDLPRSRAGRRIEFRDVSFTYSSAERTSGGGVHRVSVDIVPGSKVGFVGETGSGKSTLAMLMTRLYDPSEGQVLLDGVDVRELSRETLADAVGIVTQDPYLLHASIAENLRFARPDATQEQLEWACQMAQIHEFITELPDGYDSVVGERGYQLSGGERQRLSIARLLLKDPSVIIFDEATSALDTLTETRLLAALEAGLPGRTMVIIAHRLAAIRRADVIHVMSQGQVVESGDHGQLAGQVGEYAGLLAASAIRP
ncbi:ABC transporter ATP-binding protein [Kribbella albertanoniae]|uniref:ABC transporter ATP-binding protein n=2 Tax=Kribbella albertanoniae TaxID=1266829 RepID=A0A4R4Q2R1_9ACTN|nr:ABC transporter ATP-binding protein [Kribbella albertanoniae]